MQRLAIASVVIRDVEVYIFDEVQDPDFAAETLM